MLVLLCCERDFRIRKLKGDKYNTPIVLIDSVEETHRSSVERDEKELKETGFFLPFKKISRSREQRCRGEDRPQRTEGEDKSTAASVPAAVCGERPSELSG